MESSDAPASVSSSDRAVPITASEPAGACGQDEDADGEVAPQHADVDGPQTVEARGDGYDTDRAVVHGLI
jgi:hypothetical protein